MKVFICGPMTGLKGFNRDSFNLAAKHLRSLGHEVRNPANLDIDWSSHKDYMSVSKVMLGQCEGIVYLAGWKDSEGALDEREIAFRDNIQDVSGLLRPIQSKLITLYKRNRINVDC